MKFISMKRVLPVHALPAFLLVSSLALAQSHASLSGTIKDASGNPVANAMISIATGAGGATALSATSGADGKYKLSPIAPGSYTITVSAKGFSSNTASVKLASGAAQTLNLTLTPLPNAPGAAGAGPSLSDLGFSTQQTQSNPQLQATLQRRTEMLKIHQRLGVITLIPMAATLITGPMAKAKGRNGQPIKEPTQANLDLHAALGGATTVLYASTAYFAIRAPRIPGTHKHGAIRVHEALAWVHGAGMIITPISGAIAFKQESDGEKPSGFGKVHGTAAWVTTIAYGASIVAVSWPIHLKFWEK